MEKFEKIKQPESKEELSEVFKFEQTNGNEIVFLSALDCWEKDKIKYKGEPISEGILSDIILKTPHNDVISFKEKYLPKDWQLEILGEPFEGASSYYKKIYLSHPLTAEIPYDFYLLVALHEINHSFQEIKDGKLTKCHKLRLEYSRTGEKEDALKWLRLSSELERNAWAGALKEYRSLKRRKIDIAPLKPSEIRNLIDKYFLGSYLRGAENNKIFEEIFSDPKFKERFFVSKELFKDF